MMALVKHSKEVERGNDRNAFKVHLYDPYLWVQGILLWLSSHHWRWLRQNLEQNPGTARGPDHSGQCLQMSSAWRATMRNKHSNGFQRQLPLPGDWGSSRCSRWRSLEIMHDHIWSCTRSRFGIAIRRTSTPSLEHQPCFQLWVAEGCPSQCQKNLQLGLSRSLLTFPHGAFLSWLCFAKKALSQSRISPTAFVFEANPFAYCLRRWCGLGLAVFWQMPSWSQQSLSTKSMAVCSQRPLVRVHVCRHTARAVTMMMINYSSNM